jgi:hypothetical protein
VAEHSAALRALFEANSHQVEIDEDVFYAVCNHCERLLDHLSGDNEVCCCPWLQEYDERAQAEDLGGDAGAEDGELC